MKFNKAIDITKITDDLLNSFVLVPDSARNDNVTQWLEIVGIRVIDSVTVALIVGLRDNAPSDLLPKTDVEPIVRFWGNVGLPEGVGVFDLSGNPMPASEAQTIERVGVVITRAVFDDNCDTDFFTNVLVLTLSENISFDTLLTRDPARGLRIIRIAGSQRDTISLFANTALFDIQSGFGNIVRIRTRDAVDIRVGFDYAQLIRGGGYRDSTVYRTDVHVNNTPRRIRYSSGICYNMFKSIPNPVLRPGSSGGGVVGGSTTEGAIFTISTDRPVNITFNVFNMHGNFVNRFVMEVTWDVLTSYGQEDGERVDIYFGAEDPSKKGYLRTIPSSYFETGINVDEIPANLKWLPTNQNNRIVESGVYVFRVYFNNEYKSKWNMIVK